MQWRLSVHFVEVAVEKNPHLFVDFQLARYLSHVQPKVHRFRIPFILIRDVLSGTLAKREMWNWSWVRLGFNSGTQLCKIQQMNVMVVTTHPLAFFSGEAIWWADGTTNCDMFELLFQGSNYQPCVFIERPSNGFVFSNGFLLFTSYFLLSVYLFLIYWAVQAGLLTPLTFARHLLSPLAAFTSGTYFLHNGRRWQWICKFYTANFKGIFGDPQSECVWQHAITCCSCYRMPQNAFFPWTHNLLVSQKNDAKTFFPTLDPLPW